MQKKHFLMTLALAAATLTATGQTVTPDGGTPIAANNLTTGALTSATMLTISGTWTAYQVDKLRMAITGNTSTGSGSNAVLTTVTFNADAVMGRMEYLFYNCTALESVTMPTAPNSAAVSFYQAFRGCTKLAGTVNLSAFAAISNMASAFEGCAALEGVTLPATNTAPSGGVSFQSAFRCPTAFALATGNTMTYKRTLTQNQWATVCLPFADCIAKELSGSTGETVTFAQVQTLEANKPYIVAYTGSTATQSIAFTSEAAATIPATPDAMETEPASATYKMAGTYEDIKERSMYLLGDNSFLLYNKGNLHPFRAYITAAGGAPNQAPSLAIKDENGATGIGCMELPAAEAAAIPAISHVYTIDGRLVKTVPAEEYNTLK